MDEAVIKQIQREGADALLDIGVSVPLKAFHIPFRKSPLELRVTTVGKLLPHTEGRIIDPETGLEVARGVPGEICTRGYLVMKGYYKNQEATDAVLDEDGWFHTGDLATMSADGHFFVRGRSKNMLLGPNGQNIYPEEIEDKLNSMAMVNESIVIQSDDKLVALVHPDMEEVNNLGFTDEDLENIMEQNRKELNMQIPSFAKVSRIKLHNQEFEKTAKKSIKRYLYQNAI